MAYFLNKAFIVGNLTDDPELKYTPNGNAICRFGVATNRNMKKKDSEEWESVATFHRVVVWGKTAEWFAKTFSKGHKVMVEGRIDNRSYEDKEGVKKFISEIVAEEIIPMVADNRKPSRDEAIKEEVDETVNIDDINLDLDLDDPLGEGKKQKGKKGKDEPAGEWDMPF